MFRRLLALTTLAFALTGFAPAPGIAADANTLKGKTIRLLVGFGPGGGVDVYARLIAPYLAKSFDANVIIENQPGAGGLIALNAMMNAPADGTKISLINGSGAALSQLMGEKAVRFDLDRFVFLGNIDAPPWIWLVSPNSRMGNPQDAIKAGVVAWASTGAISGLSGAASLSCESLRIDCKIVIGYPSTGAGALALGKGEIDSMFGMDSSVVNFIKAGNAKPLVAIGRTRSKFFPETPTVYEAFTLTPEQKWLFDFQVALQDLGRILIAPPGVPADIAKELQAGVERALTEPELVKQGEKTGHFIDFLPASVARDAAIKLLRDTTPEEKNRLRAVMAKFI